MKIYTKTGDAGETGLLGGGRVPKDDPRVAACGDVDELNAAVGLAASLEPAGLELDLLQTIQRHLFTIGAELALAKALPGPRIGAGDVTTLERAIDGWEERLEPLQNFILPGGGGLPKSAALHLARAICRRAERQVVRLARTGARSPSPAVAPAVVQYLNRLSDLLFVLARAANAQAGRSDVKW